MEVATSMIYSDPYNGINLNWTAITGNNGILIEFFHREIQLHGILIEFFHREIQLHGILMKISWNYIDYFQLRFYNE